MGSQMSNNEYFSVRPKMIDHANQMASDIIRSSSIEYDSHTMPPTDYSSMAPPTSDFVKPPNRRWTVRNSQTNQQASQG